MYVIAYVIWILKFFIVGIGEMVLSKNVVKFIVLDSVIDVLLLCKVWMSMFLLEFIELLLTNEFLSFVVVVAVCDVSIKKLFMFKLSDKNGKIWSVMVLNVMLEICESVVFNFKDVYVFKVIIETFSIVVWGLYVVFGLRWKYVMM